MRWSLFVAVLLAGCGPALYTRPLVAPEAAGADERIVGLYRLLRDGSDEDGPDCLLVGEEARGEGESPRYRFVFFEDGAIRDSRSDMDLTVWLRVGEDFRGLVARIDAVGGEANAASEEGNGTGEPEAAAEPGGDAAAGPRYHNLLYTYDGGRLDLLLVLNEVIKRRIEDGSLAGSVIVTREPGKIENENILVEAGTAELVAFFAGLSPVDVRPFISAEKLHVGDP